MHNNHVSEQMDSIDSSSHRFTSTLTTAKSENDDIIRRLKIASILCLTFLIVEIVGGLLSSSLAILSDAAHLFSDLASFIIAIIASKLAQLPPNSKNTFGFQRAEAFAALFSMSSLFAVSLFLGVEAVKRGILFWNMQHDTVDGNGSGTSITGPVVDGRIMTYTACIGVFVNICLAFVLGEHHHHGPMGGGHDHSHEHEHEHQHGQDEHENGSHENGAHVHEDHPPSTSSHSHSHDHHHESSTEEKSLLLDDGHHNTDYTGTDCKTVEVQEPSSSKERNVNLQAAYLHVLADLLQSVCVLLSGLIIWYNPRWQLFDPVVTILFCIFVVKSTIGVIVSSISVLMNDVPSNINWEEVCDGIMSVEGISGVQDLHIWSTSHSNAVLSVHANYGEAYTVEDALEQIQNVCKKFGIHRTTIQLQPAVSKEAA